MCYMYYLKYLKIHNSIMRILLDGLKRVNIKISSYYFFLDELYNKTIPHLDTGFDDYEILHLGSDGMKIVGCYSREGYS